MKAGMTLMDVCREAGVSLATADRVLNGRSGVRESTALRVKRASEKLGYKANPFAVRLAKKASFRLAFVLPTGTNAFMQALEREVALAADHWASQRIFIEPIHTDVFNPQALANSLRGLDSYHGVAVVALDHPLVREAIDRLEKQGVYVLTLVSDVPGSKRFRYVGVDNIAAGRTAGTLLGRFSCERSGPVGIIIGSADLRDHFERLFGFTQVVHQEYSRLKLLPPRTGQDEDSISAAAIRELLAEHPDMVGVYSVGAGTAGIAQALHASGRKRGIVFIGHEVTEQSRQMLIDGTIDALIHQDPGHEVRSAARLLIARLMKEPILPDQERIRIEIFLRDNLP